jgi:hypothetical protein
MQIKDMDDETLELEWKKWCEEAKALWDKLRVASSLRLECLSELYKRGLK